MNQRSDLGSALAVAFAVFIVDRILKLAVESFMRVGEGVTVIPGLLRLTYVTNPGGAFGSLPGRGVLLMVGSLLAVGVVVCILATGKTSRLATIGCGLIVGGTVGNLFDRVVSGKVTDYLSLFYVFNAADFAIIGGLGALLLASLLSGGRDSAGAYPSPIASCSSAGATRPPGARGRFGGSGRRRRPSPAGGACISANAA